MKTITKKFSRQPLLKTNKFRILLLIQCILFFSTCSVSAQGFGSIDALKDSLAVLAQKADNEIFKLHFESILQVINSQTSFSSDDSSFLYSLHQSLYNEGDTSDMKDFNNYLNREHDILISWTSPTDGVVSLAWLRLPKNWDPENSYPLYVFIHGSDWWSPSKIGYLAFSMINSSYSTAAYDDGYFLRPWGRGNGIVETDIWECLSTIEGLFKIDTQRRYLTGHSSGGYAAWLIGQRSTDYWAAMGVQAGWFIGAAEKLDYNHVWRLQNTPVLFICGTGDSAGDLLVLGYNRLVEIGNTRTEWLSFSGGHVINEAELLYLYSWFQRYSKPDPVISNFNGAYALADSATIFGEGVVSIPGRNEFAPFLSATGDSMYFSTENNDGSALSSYLLTQESGVWSAPEEILLKDESNNSIEVYLNSDNTILYFTQRTGTDSQNYEYRFWKTVRNSNGSWSDPVEAEEQLNSIRNKRRINVVNNQNIYFSADGDLYFSTYQPDDGTYASPQKFEYPVNTDSWEGDLYVNPQENYLLFSSSREDGQNKDIYISYKFNNGLWTNPKKLIPAVNTANPEFSPYMSPNERFLFFSRTVGDETNIYWIENHFTESLKNTNFITYRKSDFEDIHVPLGKRMMYKLPDTVLIDDDGIPSMTFSVAMANGQDMPGWLKFARASQVFSGTPDATGSYEVEFSAVEDAGTKVSGKITIYVDENSDIVSKIQDDLLRICPNPAHKVIFILNEDLYDKVKSGRIYSLDGKLIKQSTIMENRINISGLPKGIYLLNLDTTKGIFTEKIVIE